MITVTVIKSPKVECRNCHEAHRVVEEVVSGFPGKVKLEVFLSNTPEANAFGIISTPLVAVNGTIYSMGKPVISERVREWIERELA
jgi:predicted thioredoxin/glutaredoxin